MFEQRQALPARIVTYAYDYLRGRVRPQSLDAPEALPFVLYDTVTYLAAGSSHLDAFKVVNADPTLSNMDVAGSLPEGVYFDIHRLFITPLRPVEPTTGVAFASGGISDIAVVLNTARLTWTLTVNAKPIGPIPGRFAGDAGQPSFAGSAAAAATTAAGLSGFPMNGGFPFNGSVKLGPSQKFGVGLDAVSTAIGANLLLQVSLLGILYRKVG